MQKLQNRIIALALALMLVCAAAASAEEAVPAAAETPFAFYNGIGWDTTVEQFQTAMGDWDEADYTFSEHGDQTSFMYPGVEYNGEALSVSGYYLRGQMVLAAYLYPQDAAETFDDRLETLMLTYGEPTLFDKAEAAALFTAMEAGAFDQEMIARLAGWTLSDGTAAYLFDISGWLCVYYFNAQALLNESE